MKAYLFCLAFLTLYVIVLSQSNLPDWDFCTTSSQCADNCCSKQYSSDGRLKCTPNGSPDQCVGRGNNTGAGKNWAGSCLYYAAGLSQSQQDYLFSNLRSAGIKVLRVWLDGQTNGYTKGTPITSFPSLEYNAVGEYDPTVLNLYDTVMITANKYGIKLMISFHSWNALSGGDVYSKKWGTSGFYADADAQAAYDNRIRYVMTHTNSKLGKQWKDLSDYIFAFETQNEAMIGLGQDFISAHQSWQCDRASTIRSVLGSNSSILVTTGGESWTDESLQPDWFSCASLDIIAIHSYGLPGDASASKLSPYVTKAKSAGKMIIVQEWGACYFNTDNNLCPTGDAMSASQREQNIRDWADAISSAGVPWMYWQIIPNADPHWGGDYEIGIGDPAWPTFQSVANNTDSYSSAWDWSAHLLY